MRLETEQQEFNLAQYLTHLVLPTFDHMDWGERASDSHLPATFARVTVLEAVCWLRLGIMAGYFPPGAGRRAFATWASGFGDLLEPLKLWDYLFNPYFLTTVYEYDRIGDVDESAGEFEQGSSILPIFRSALVRSMRLGRDRMAEVATIALNFYNMNDVEKTLIAPIQSEDIQRAVELKEAFNDKTGVGMLAAVYVGFGEWLAYLDSYRSSYLAGLESSEVSSADLATMARRIAQIQEWRFKALSRRSANYVGVREALVAGTARAYALPEGHRAALQGYTGELLDFWDARAGEKLLAAGAS
jgi:hypothetical protein